MIDCGRLVPLLGLFCISLGDARAFSPWAMGIPYGAGQLFVAGILLFSRSRRTEMKPKSHGEGRFAFEGLDRINHERARLSVLTSLIASPKGFTFDDLKAVCALTDGNLTVICRAGARPSFEIAKGQEQTGHSPSAALPAGPQAVHRISDGTGTGGAGRSSRQGASCAGADRGSGAFGKLKFFWA